MGEKGSCFFLVFLCSSPFSFPSSFKMIGEESGELLRKTEGEGGGSRGTFKEKKEGFGKGGDGREEERRTRSIGERTIGGVVGGEEGISFT